MINTNIQVHTIYLSFFWGGGASGGSHAMQGRGEFCTNVQCLMYKQRLSVSFIYILNPKSVT